MHWRLAGCKETSQGAIAVIQAECGRVTGEQQDRDGVKIEGEVKNGGYHAQINLSRSPDVNGSKEIGWQSGRERGRAF